MPVVNGLQAAPPLRKKLPQTPIIMFTMHASKELVRLATGMGISAVVSKDEEVTHLAMRHSLLEQRSASANPSPKAPIFLTPASDGRTILANPSPMRTLDFGRCCMYRPPPLRGAQGLAGKTVLLIDRNQRTREVRASVLRSRGVQVHEADSLQAARFLWQPKIYDVILLDMRRHLPGEALEFYEQIRDKNPEERFAFLVGPPVYLSRTWPVELAAHGASQGQWKEAVHRFLTAA